MSVGHNFSSTSVCGVFNFNFNLILVHNALLIEHCTGCTLLLLLNTISDLFFFGSVLWSNTLLFYILIGDGSCSKAMLA
jgi:hypothetical protein